MRCAWQPDSFEISFVDAVLFIELFHVPGIEADNGHVNDQRTLRRHIKAKWKPKEGNAVQFSRIPSFHECCDKPNDQQHRRDKQIFAPIFVVFCGKLHTTSLIEYPGLLNVKD